MWQLLENSNFLQKLNKPVVRNRNNDWYRLIDFLIKTEPTLGLIKIAMMIRNYIIIIV